MQSILLVGGTDDVASKFAKHLSTFGVSNVFHLDDPRAVRKVDPNDYDTIVLVTNGSSQKLSTVAENFSTNHNKPLVCVQHRWSLAEPKLRSLGFLPSASVNGASNINTQEAAETAIDYILTQRRDGRVPPLGEVEGVLQRGFGPGYSLSSDHYTEWCNRAAEIHLRETSSDALGEEVLGYGRVLLEEYPELTLNNDEYLKRLQGIVKDLKVKPDLFKARAAEALMQVKARWDSDEDALHEARMRYAVRLMQVRYEDNQSLMPMSEIRTNVRAVFGSCMNNTYFPEVRGRAIGEWADDTLLFPKTAHERFLELTGSSMSRSDFDDLVLDGWIPSVKSNRMHIPYETTERAIQSFLQDNPAYLSGEEEAAPAPDPEPEPTAEPEPPLTIAAPDFSLELRELSDSIHELTTTARSMDETFGEELAAIKDRLDALESRAHTAPSEAAKQPEAPLTPPLLTVASLTLTDGSCLVLDPNARIDFKHVVIKGNVSILKGS